MAYESDWDGTIAHNEKLSQIQDAVSEERERCAKICESRAVYYVGTEPTKLIPGSSGEPIGRLFAEAIRGGDTERSGQKHPAGTCQVCDNGGGA